MKKKAECEARESLQPAHCANTNTNTSTSDSVSSVTDDARELIEAMQGAAVQPSSQVLAGTEKSQKSRARRLTSTTVALEDVSKQEAGSVGDASGEGF